MDVSENNKGENTVVTLSLAHGLKTWDYLVVKVCADALVVSEL